MPERQYLISPYCVLYPNPCGETASLVHGRYGSTFELSRELLLLLGELISGVPFDPYQDNWSADERAAIEMLIAEKVLIERSEFETLSASQPFKNRLNPVEFSVLRKLNEGGYFSNLVDSENPPAVRKVVKSLSTVQLDVDQEFNNGREIVDCLMARRSIRYYADTPLPIARLSQFLQITARCYGLIETPNLGWTSLRNYPSGGARYPLELTLVCKNVESLEDGLYYYDAWHHRLELLASDPDHLNKIREIATYMMGGAGQVRGEPAVIFLITAVFERTAWKYTNMAYHLILQETGALYQTMYLAATLLDLAPCSMGAFPELATAEILGLNPLDESQVGFFALGMPDNDALNKPIGTVASVKLLDQSPFSTAIDNKAVELTFVDGRKQIIDLGNLAIEGASDQTLLCRVTRGRETVLFTKEATSQIESIMVVPKV